MTHFPIDIVAYTIEQKQSHMKVQRIKVRITNES